MADKKYDLKDLRNIGIIAHIDAGKTTTTEAILYRTGLKHKIGEVHEGDTTTDWMAQEKERGITITAAAVTCFWKDKKINLIDTPGHIDFTVEVERSLRVLDGAVVVFDGKMGVESQSETVWRQADKYHVPRICFINKINQTGGDFYKSLDSIHHRLSKRAFPIHLPIGFEQSVSGIVDLITMKAYTYKDYSDKNLTEEKIPADLMDQVKKYRSLLVENAVAEDEKMLEKYFEVGEEGLNEDEIKQAIRTAVLTGKFFAVTGGDGRGVIVEKLLDAITDFLPSPLDRGSTWGTNPKNGEEIERRPDTSQPFTALAFKIATDVFVGKLAFFRVYSGKVVAGSYILNSSTGDKERIGRIVRMHADKREDVTEVEAGDIAAIVGLKGTTTGNTLCDPAHPIVLESITFPEPPVSIAIEPKTKADQEKMGVALQRLAEEDPTFRIKSDIETGQTIISGMGELHLEIIVDRMKREFTVEANVGAPQVAYKETIQSEAEAEGKYIRQSGGRGQYGHCFLRVEPKNRGEGFEFKNEVVGGSIPREFVPAVEKGVKEAMENGVIAGYPLVDMTVAVFDGTYHEVDSSEIAFKIAGSMALQAAVKLADPVLLEPIMKVEVTTPEEFMGEVIGDLSSKRAQILGTVQRAKVRIITALVPLAELSRYATILRSKTQGRAIPYIEPSHYEEVPAGIALTVISGSKKGKPVPEKNERK